jgi:hypothetical protein
MAARAFHVTSIQGFSLVRYTDCKDLFMSQLFPGFHVCQIYWLQEPFYVTIIPRASHWSEVLITRAFHVTIFPGFSLVISTNLKIPSS